MIATAAERQVASDMRLEGPQPGRVDLATLSRISKPSLAPALQGPVNRYPTNHTRSSQSGITFKQERPWQQPGKPRDPRRVGRLSLLSILCKRNSRMAFPLLRDCHICSHKGFQ